ncbi:hypothetical protein FGG08_000138 [Glutinoglossum americanum]|uniref:SUN domain-containing protein n=1 Tax=Glutinoglossum americanum TaxID=1670608 RepID=A0A9P8IDG8_9PEZI|nr:hypothetical protein FGG08_000138 [Glutinoglossum americanum]
MATPRSKQFRGGPITPTPSRNRRNQPPEAELPVLDTASNRLYGSTIPALPNDSETGVRLTQSSIALNMAGSRAPRTVGSVSARSERSNRDERAARRDVVRESKEAPLSEDAALSTGVSTLPPIPLVPPEIMRPGTGGTTSRTWGQETGFNAQAGLGIGQTTLNGSVGSIPPGSARDTNEQVFMPNRRTTSSVRDDFDDHGGPVDSEVSESSGDGSIFLQQESGRDAPNFVVSIFRPIAQFTLALGLLLLILWGAGRTGLLQRFGLPGFPGLTRVTYLESGSTREIIQEVNSAVSGRLQSLHKDIVADLVEIKETQKLFALNETVEVELKKVYAILGKLTQNSLMHDESIKSLRSILPELTWVSRSATGEIVIQQDFWLALRSQIEHEFGKSKPSSKEADLWDRFLEINESRMRPYIAGQVENNIRKAGSEGVLVTREHFIAIIQDNFEKHSQDMRKLTEIFEEKYRKTDKRMDSINKDMERKVAITAMQKVEALSNRISRTLPAAQLEALVQANIDRNSQQALTSVNYFSPGMGAIADPRHSSHRYRPKLTMVRWLISKIVPDISCAPKELEVTLYGWEEPLDCWCSANITDSETLGHAQVAITTSVDVYPTDITIEHIPRTAVPSVRNAPKDMELWVNVPESTPPHNTLKGESEALLGPTPPAGSKAGKGWLRISTWRYTPYGVNHVLNFPVQVELERLKVPGKYFFVRATTNWGADSTCFYRIRMGGKVADPDVWGK